MTYQRFAVKVNFNDGDHVKTEINGTRQSVTDYYKIGKTFNLGRTGDRLVQVTSLEFLN